MKKVLRSGFAVLAVSSLVVVPAASITFIATADAAFAKSDKAGGGGNGKGGQGSSKSKSASSKGKSDRAKTNSASAKSKSAKGGKSGNGLSKFIDRLSGKEKAQEKTARPNAQSKSKASVRRVSAPKVMKSPVPAERPQPDARGLGKMNGALNANVNAIIAHMKNGNTNGPIGGMAALALAKAASDGANDTVALADQYAALDQLLIDNGYVDADGNPDRQAYLDAVAGTPGNGSNSIIEDAVNGTGDLTLEDALLGANNGVQDFTSLEDYEAWRDGTTGDTPNSDIDTLLADLDGSTRPTDEEIDSASSSLDDVTAAEDYLLSIWNKGDGDNDVRSEEEIALLEKLHGRLDADSDAITAALTDETDEPSAQDEMAEINDETTDCDADVVSCDDDGLETLASTE